MLDLDDVLDALSVLGLPKPEYLAGVLDLLVPTFSSSDAPELQAVYESATTRLASDPDNIEAYFARGVVCQTKGWHLQALDDFMEVIRRQREHPRAWRLLSDVLSSLGEFDKARAVWQVALQLDLTQE